MVKTQVSKGIFILLLLLPAAGFAQETPGPDPFSYDSNQVLHPEWYIKVTDWSFFTAARVAMLSSVVIENTAEIAYKDIKVRLLYGSYSYPAAGTIATTTGVLPITVPPKSKETYLKGGIPMGAGNQGYKVTDIEILSATPIKN